MAAKSPAETKYTSDPYRLHPVMLALGKARAATALLARLADEDGPEVIPSHLAADDGWLSMIAEEAVFRAFDEAEAAFRASLTPEQAREQMIGGPQAVA